MTLNEYIARRDFLKEVLADAERRGDYYLENDTAELLDKLHDDFYATGDDHNEQHTEE